MARVEARTRSDRPALAESAAAAIRRGPSGVLSAFLVMLLLACAGTVLLLSFASADGDQPTLNSWVRAVAAALGAVSGGALLLRAARPPAPSGGEPGTAEPGRTRTTALLSLGTLALLAVVPAYLLAARTQPPSENWIGYEFFDKRWLVATFLLGTIGVMVVATAVDRVVRAATAAPASWGGWARAAFGPRAGPYPEPPAPRRERRRTLLLGGGAVLLAAFFFAPPWHPALSEVNLHEAPMLAGVQAIANGATPYIDAAAVQYGPGSELIHYAYLEAFGYDLESFRQSTALLYWVAATIFFVVTFLRLPWRLALIACLASVLFFPALQMVSFQPDGSIDGAVDRLKDSEGGFWGWPNAFRYLGIYCLAMLLPAIALMRDGGRAKLAALALGAGWGLACFISQENLLGGALVIVTLSLLLALSRTVSPRRLLDSLSRLALGFAAFAAFVFGYYAANGDLGRFLELYYLIPSAVADGYSNTVYFAGFDGDWGQTYHLLPFALGALCIASLVRLGPLRLVREWSPERVLLVSALVAACVAHTGSLLRSDPPHLINTMLILPVAVTLAVACLPKLLGLPTVGGRRALAVGIAAAVVAMIPLTQVREAPNRLASPVARFDYESPALAWQRADPDSVASRRLTPEVVSRPGQWCCTSFRYPVSMRELPVILNRLNAIVGDRRTYVANFIDELPPGGAYFLADLKPAPILFEPYSMAMSERLLNDFLVFFEDHISGVEAIVAVYPDLPEVRMFERAYPDHRRIEVPYTYGSITVLVRDPAPA